MNDLGLTLSWLAVQVALLLVPALVVQAVASRRGPAAGAWVGGLSLGLVLALSVTALLPRSRVRNEARSKASSAPASVSTGAANLLSGRDRDVAAPRAAGRGWALADLRLAWARFERGAAAPAARFRPWGTRVVFVALVTSGIGLLRLMAGLWGVRLCRRYGKAVVDSDLTALLAELRGAMGCQRWVELREVSDLTTPATAGWWRPVVFLPDDWPSWDDSERRAVLAHELAHIIRGDYATGLLARASVVLHAYHPLVHWMAGRLQMQQELAADALGARFAGGRVRYLVALSRLALRQDGRSPCWPARAFLPPRGTLIRRIAMLNQDTEAADRTWHRSSRVFVGLCLMGIACAVATLRGPARATAADPPAGGPGTRMPTANTAEPVQREPIELVYIPDDAVGVVAFRPAATFRRSGMEKWAETIEAYFARDLEPVLVRELGIDPAQPGLPRLHAMDIDWVVCGFRVGNGGSQLHQLLTTGFAIRTTEPFDWLKMIHAWGLETTQADCAGVAYRTFTQPFLGPGLCGIYCPDESTLVLDSEERIRSLIQRGGRSLPSFVQTPRWRKASRGLLAVVIDAQNDSFIKNYDLGRPDDAVVLSLAKGVDHWIFGVADSDDMILHASAECQSRDASEAMERTIASLRKLGQAALEHPAPAPPGDEGSDRSRDMEAVILANLRIDRSDRSIDVFAKGFGTLADFAALIAAESGANAQEREVKEDLKQTKREFGAGQIAK